MDPAGEVRGTERAPDTRSAGGGALREGAELYRLIVEGARDYVIYTTDREGRIESWSPGAEAAFGWMSADAIGQPFAMTFTPEDRELDEPARELVTAAENDVAPDIRWHLRSDGTRVFIDGTTRALRDDVGRLRGFLKIGQDVTRRREMAATAEHARAATERDSLRRQLLQAEEDERRRLSRELHDEVGQHLTALGLGLQALSDVTPPGSEADRRAQQLRGLVSTMGRELHALAVRLRPKALDDFGLEPALAAYAEEWSRKSGISVAVHAPVTDERLPDAVESAVYRIVQEALTNAAKHSEATRVGIVVERREGYVHAIVEDDGRGFDPIGALDTQPSGRLACLGLLGIWERAALLGGTVDIESTPGSGTTLFARIPIDDPHVRRENPEQERSHD